MELAKLFNRPVHVFDQERNGWFAWQDNAWVADVPVLEKDSFVGTGTRNLSEEGRKAIRAFFEKAFGPA